MNTPTGVKTLTVGAVVIDYTSDQGAVFVEREHFVAWFKDDRVDTFEVYLKPGADLEERTSENAGHDATRLSA